MLAHQSGEQNLRIAACSRSIELLMKRVLLVVLAGLALGSPLSLQSVADAPRIIFSRVGPFQSQLFVAHGDGSNERPIAPATGLASSPSLSHDKEWVIFTSERAGSAEIYRMRLDGTALNG
jgi:hypothetical protein